MRAGGAAKMVVPWEQALKENRSSRPILTCLPAHTNQSWPANRPPPIFGGKNLSMTREKLTNLLIWRNMLILEVYRDIKKIFVFRVITAVPLMTKPGAPL